MSVEHEEYYTSMSDIDLKQRRIEFIEFMKKIFDNDKRNAEFETVLERYEFVENLLRKRNVKL